LKVVAGIGVIVLVLALVVGGVALATRGSDKNVADVTSTQVTAKRAPTVPGKASAPAHAGQDVTKAGQSAAQKCATEEKQSEAGDDNDRSGDDGPDGGGGSDDCGADAEGNDPTGADQQGTGEEGGDPSGDDGRGGDADSGDNKND
jgi:hypothetical protein